MSEVSSPTEMRCVIPSRCAVGEEFSIKIRVLGEVRPIDAHGGFCTPKPALHGPYNLNVQRSIQFVDNCLPEWRGRVSVDGSGALDGPEEIIFDGIEQGSFPGDKRPIRKVKGFRWTKPGFHFVRLVDKESGIEAWSNAVYVTEEAPVNRIYWGDPHWQTFFSDGIRCPEELYHFAKEEGFLDFGAISDHMEAVTDRQWNYFQAVTNDYNIPGEFATLQGQEWTHHNKDYGAPGHRNIYYRGDSGPVLRSNDPNCNTLEKLWARLDEFGEDALAIPHHSANAFMGVDWQKGWNPKYEKTVEIYSCWGSSEKHEDDGNLRPMHPLQLEGEKKGQHVIDALKLGYRFGFVGGGDIHAGRPGDSMHQESYPPTKWRKNEQGFTAAICPELTRENIYDALRDRSTYATTQSRIYLDVQASGSASEVSQAVKAASEDGITRLVLVRNTGEMDIPLAGDDRRVCETTVRVGEVVEDDFAYIRMETGKTNMAWSSPVWPEDL